MTRYSFSQACSALGTSHNRRRPAGVSRRQKHRQLKFESLEDRRVMSANPVAQGADDYMVLTREQALSDEVINAFERSSNLSQYTDEALMAAEDWVVLMSIGGNVQTLEDSAGVEVLGATGIIPDTYIVSTEDESVETLIASLSSSDEIDYFYPLIDRLAITRSIPNDPYLQYQWHLINFGQNTGSPDWAPTFGIPGEDINVKDVWDSGITGTDVQIGIVEGGFETTHPDLVNNISSTIPGLSYGPSGNLVHGTAVAGLAAGDGNNSLGTTGVAYDAELVSIDLFSGLGPGPLDVGINDFRIAQAFTYENQEIEVYNHSWGFVGETHRTITDLGPLATTALRNSVFFGRGGLGNIHVVASGNDAGDDTSSQYEGFANSRYTIAVSGVDETGSLVGYAEGGANILVSAPTSTNPQEIIRDTNLGSGIWTTDLEGEAGNNNSANTPVDGFGNFDPFGYVDYFDSINFDVGAESIDYGSRFNGTSASAPIVSGVVALMLDANPNLSYRDVQHILVASARQATPTYFGWQTNLRELQHDPAPSSNHPGNYADSNSTWWNPSLSRHNPVHKVERHQALFTNGAGYTVYQGLGSYGDLGLGHGVVDAELAVEMAKNWVSVGGQTSELTYATTLGNPGKVWGHVISAETTGSTLIPGGLAAEDDTTKDFEAFYNEWTKETDLLADPMADPPFEDENGPLTPFPINDRDFLGPDYLPGAPIFVPGGMSVEWIEVELTLDPATNMEDMDFLRVTLVSPEGTQSELTVFGTPVTNITDHDTYLGPAGNAAGNLGTTTMVLTTNRHWGERTEDRVRVGEYLDRVDYDDDGVRNEVLTRVITDKENELAVFDEWRLVFSNYGEQDIDIFDVDIAFHGSDVSGTGRVQGTVGVDDNGNGVFSAGIGEPDNFSRYSYQAILSNANHAAERSLLSPAVQESWAAGVIVYADLDGNGFRDPTDPHFQVGADGNYYFDLLPGTHDLRIDPTSLQAAGLETVANMNIANAGPFATVIVDNVGQRVINQTFLDREGLGNTPGVEFSVKGNADLNVLLDPPPEAPQTINISGVVYADLNENGIQDGTDFAIDNADVYIDINKNGVYTPGVDYLATTDADGEYLFESGANGVPATTPSDFYIVRVLEGTTGPFGTPINPVTGEYGLFFDYQVPVIIGDPGYVATNVDFGFGQGGVGGGTVGSVSGTVFNDINANGVRDAGEDGLQNAANVYLDIDGDNMRGPDDPVVAPAANGAYAFGALPVGSYDIRIEFSTSQYDQTTPSGPVDAGGNRIDEDDWEYNVTVAAGDVFQDLDFGLQNKSTMDYGDLPDIYGTTLASGGPSHIVFGDLYLGDVPTDAELDAPIQLDGSGDDVTGFADEDGITFSTIFNGAAPSTEVTLTVDANVDGGYLQGWMDFNENGVFDASERVFTDELLPAGESVFVIPIPADLTGGGGTVYARFRYGEEGITSHLGPAIKGEVEDYAIPVVSNAIDPGGQPENGPDFDSNGFIDGLDFLAWQRGFGSIGSVGASDGDSDNDNDVDLDDYDDWAANFGTTAPAAASATSTEPEEVAAVITEEDLTVESANLPSEAELVEVSTEQVPQDPSTPNEVRSGITANVYTANPIESALIVDSGVKPSDIASSIPVVKHINSLSGEDSVTLSTALRSFTSEGRVGHQEIVGKFFESHVSDTSSENTIDAEDLGFAMRDRVLDQLFAKRQRSWEDRLEKLHERDFGVDDAFAVALGEELDWRFG